ncbi:Rossmann-like alpha/beta/alpha sandwich fold containing protein [Parasponia andersonii]|uniref:Rossmann-like alpha/beta/alpha sandwich fold containing protein n=1 Tax=Parasponia andersonii TaxID=3476 RepID=A0A2P5BXJ2_PARAD|nr:Rossmann-like alpha/beta/alpha sandwich fold containing protein [Parasponia andersonii]
MAFAHYLPAISVETSRHPKDSFPASSSSSFSECLFSVPFSSASLRSRDRQVSLFTRFSRMGHKAKAQPQEADVSSAADAFTGFKHLLLPITDRNPYLSEGTRQAVATTASLAKKYGADITVVVIDERQKESLPEHETQLSSVRWHLSEGGFQEFRLLERLGEGSKPTAIIGEVADDLNLDLVVISMEAIHSKHVDANLLAEFMPCPVILLPL